MSNSLLQYTLQQADNCLILGQRLAAWCGHGPILEQDIALTNISLDQIGQARLWYQYAAEVEGKGRSEDDLAYLRDAWQFRNVLLVEQPNGDFAQTILRQFLFDSFSCYFYEALLESANDQIAAIAAKSHKEAIYHLKWSSDWVIRLGDGTEESRKRMMKAVGFLWPYSNELILGSEADLQAQKEGYGVNLSQIRKIRDDKINQVMQEATLDIPIDSHDQVGGKIGRHSEHLGYILAEMQFLQRAYPGLDW
ncbi:MAG: 1,2-phenylacetyl-CoA epoxidase subunit PaaC [Bacteroidota bacterium]